MVLRLDRPANTLISSVLGPNIFFARRKLVPRSLTEREIAHCMGFPNDFMLGPTRAACTRQLGNSVAVPVVKDIALRIAEALQCAHGVTEEHPEAV